MKNKYKVSLLSLAIVPAAVVAVADEGVQAQGNEEQAVISESWYWTSPHHIYDTKQVQQRIASVGAIVANTETSYTATNVEELKNVIYENLKQFNTSFTIQYTGNTSTLKADWGTIFNGIPKDPTMQYEAGTLSEFGFGASGYENDMTITAQVSYYTNAVQEQFVTQEVKRIAGEIFKTTVTDFDKVKAVNEYIALNTTYSTEASTSVHAAYTILNEGKGVCQAYALLAYRLLKEAGLEAYYVSGEGKNVPHAWNLVKVDGEWFHLDTTWNDPTFGGNLGDMSGYIGYGYFLISDDEIIKKEHTIDNHGYPAATSNKYISLHGVSNPVEVNSVWYYSNRNDDLQFYKLDLSNLAAGTQKVSDVRIMHLNYADEWLYFSNYSAGATLHKMKIDGSQLTRITDFKITSLKIENNQLIYKDVSNTVHTTPLKDQVTIDQEAADSVSALINAIDNTTDKYVEDVANARAAYNALTAQQQDLVTNVQKLTDYEADIQLTNEAIAAVTTVIANIDEFAEDFAEKVQAATALYNELDETEQAKITNSHSLQQAQQKVIDNTKIAEDLKQLIETINVTNANYFALTNNARDTYNVLTLAQKKLIDAGTLTKLEQAEQRKLQDEKAVENINYQLDLVTADAKIFKATIELLIPSIEGLSLTAVQKTLVTKMDKYNDLKAAHQTYLTEMAVFESEITAIASATTEQFATKVQAANAKWESMNLAQQQYISPEAQQKLTAYVAQIAADLLVANTVQAQITALTLDNASFVTDVEAATTAFAALTDTQKSLVTNEAALQTHESSAIKINSAIAAIGAIPQTATADYKSLYDVAKQAYDQLTAVEKTHVSNEAAYTTAQQYVHAANTVDTQITALTVPYAVEAVEAVSEAYAQLHDIAKALVLNKATLQAAELAVKEQRDTIKADAVSAQIANLASVTESFIANYEAAVTAYDALTEDQKLKVTNYTNVTALAETVQKIKAAIASIAQIDAQPAATLADYEARVQQATASLSAVDAAYSVAVTNATVLTNASTLITNVQNVLTAISNLSIQSSTGDIAAAKTAYELLSPQEKVFVTTYNTVAQIENEIAANGVIALIFALNEASPTFIADVASAQAAYNALLPQQQTLVSNIADLHTAKLKADAIAASMQEVANVIQLIAQINETSATFATNLAIAQQAYDVLTDEQKTDVTNVADLASKAAVLEQYKQIAISFESQVTSIDTASVTFVAEVEAGSIAYNVLDDAKRSLISNITVAQLQQYIEDAKTIRRVEAQILALNSLSATYYAEVEGAQQAYDALANYQALLSTEALQKLQAAQALVAADKEVAQAVQEQITALTNTSTLTDVRVTDVRAARAAYNALTANQQQLVTNVSKLAQLEQAQSNTTNNETGHTNTTDPNTGVTNNGGSSNTGVPSNPDTSSNTDTSTEPVTPSYPSTSTDPVTPSNPESATNQGTTPNQDNLTNTNTNTAQPTAPQIVQEGNALKVNVSLAQESSKVEPIQITVSPAIQITIPIKAIPQGKEGTTVAFAIEQQDGRIKLQATIDDQPAKFASYIEFEIANLPNNAVLLRIDENGNKIATPFVMKDGKHVIKTMTPGEFIVSTEEKTFEDVAKDGHKQYIEELAKRHIVLGASEESFNPNAGISRAQFSTMIARAMGLQPEGTTTFKDVEGKWYADSVQALYEAGIVNGKSEDSFDPGQTLTRQQATLMVVRLLDFIGVELPEVDLKEVPFKDFDNIPKNYQDAVAKVYALGIFSGKPDGTFNPSGELTRSQMAKVLYKTLQLAEML